MKNLFLFLLMIVSINSFAQPVPSVRQYTDGNLLTNPGFEQGKSGWILSSHSIISSLKTDGKYSLLLSSGGFDQSAIQDVDTSYLPGVTMTAWCNIWSNRTNLKMCVRKNGVVTNSCVNIESNPLYQTYDLFSFVAGTSTTGIEISSTGTGAGSGVDQCFLGIRTPSMSQDVAAVGPWIDYGPITITATTTNPTKATTKEQDSVRCRQSGQDYECEYRYQANSATGSGAGSGSYLFSLPVGVEFASNQPLATVQTYTGAGSAAQVYSQEYGAAKIGSGRVSATLSAGSIDSVEAFAVSSNRFQVLLYNFTGSAGHLNSNYFSVTGANTSYSFFVKFRGAGLNSRVSLYSQQCRKPSDCRNDFSAKIANNGTTASITSQSGTWLSTATRNSQGVVTLDFVSGIFTVTPSCTTTPINSAGVSKALQFDSISTTQAVIRIRETSAGGLLDLPFDVHCDKQGVDSRERNMITGTFKDVATTTDFSGSSAITITATGTAPTKGVTAKDSIRWHREGKWMVIYLDYQQTASTGAVNGTGKYLILVPDGKTIDSSIVSFNTNTSGVAALTPAILQGNCSGAFGGANGLVGFPAAHSSTQFYITGYFGGSPNAWGPAGVGGFASTAAVNINCVIRIPITEWAVN